MANFPSVTAAGAFESTTVQNAIKALATEGLATRLAALEYDSGERNLTALAGAAVSGGTLTIHRIGGSTWLKLYGLTIAQSASIVTLVSTGVLPVGMRPPQNHRWNHPLPDGRNIRFGPAPGGNVIVSESPQVGDVIFATVSWPTPGPPPSPTALPGTPL